MADFKGKVQFITETEEVGNGERKFKKRLMAVTSETEVNGQVYENSLSFEAQGDKTALLDTVNVGDTVNVVYGISGNISVKKDVVGTPKNPEHKQCFNTVKMINVTVLEKVAEEPFSLG